MQDILREVCEALIEVLAPIYLPNLNEDTWKKIADEFEQRWQVPHCVGALDGMHVALLKPPDSGSLFFNYKKFFSIVFLAICDAYKRFVWFNVGHYGKTSFAIQLCPSKKYCDLHYLKKIIVGSFNDASIFTSSDLYRKMCDKSLHLPKPEVLTGTKIVMPYFFVGDNIFGLHENMMKPYSKSAFLSKRQRIYNYRISRGRITIECAFGILNSRWRILGQPLGCKVQTSESIVSALALLHNFVITENLKFHDPVSSYDAFKAPKAKSYENGPEYVDDEDLNVFGNSIAQREELGNYFSSPQGSVPWQDAKL